jgi:hypothetical protein
MEAPWSSEPSIPARATRPNIPENGIRHFKSLAFLFRRLQLTTIIHPLEICRLFLLRKINCRKSFASSPKQTARPQNLDSTKWLLNLEKAIKIVIKQENRSVEHGLAHCQDIVATINCEESSTVTFRCCRTWNGWRCKSRQNLLLLVAPLFCFIRQILECVVMHQFFACW